MNKLKYHIIYNMNKFSIQNNDSYYNSIQENYFTIFNNYSNIIIEYLKYCHDNIYFQHQQYKKYIIKQGITCVTHVFNFLLLYTKNLELTINNCQKAYIYYIEFIGQISEDNHSFLQLNSKDAMLFVYKKTIFDINYDIYKNTNIYNSKLDTIDLFINIYQIIINKIISSHSLIESIKIINIDVNKSIQRINKIYNDYQDDKFLKEIIKFLNLQEDENIIDVLDIYIRKYKKNYTNLKHLT